MNEYRSRGKEILKIFINNGYEAYFVGETVRNIILGKSIKTIEITTSAHLDIVKNLFRDCLIVEENEKMITLEYAGYNYNIKSFISGEISSKAISTTKHYSKNLLDDLANRDYSINAIAMSHSGKLTDAHDGYLDIKKKRITHIGNAKNRFFKDPCLIIRAFVLISELGFKIAPKTYKAIKKRKKYLLHGDINLILDELKQMFEGAYTKKAICELYKMNVYKMLPMFKKLIKYLRYNYKKSTFEEILLMTDVLNGKLNENFKEYVKDYEEYSKVFDLVIANKKSKYDSVTLYTNGLKVCLYANRINYLLGRCRKKDNKITKQYDRLIIKNIDELNYRINDIKNIIYEKDYEKINYILEETLKLVLLGEIRNVRNEVEKTIIQLLQKNNIYYNLQGINNSNEEKSIIQETQNKTNVITNVNDSNKQIVENINDITDSMISELIKNEILDQNIDKEKFRNDLNDFIFNYFKKGDN